MKPGQLSDLLLALKATMTTDEETRIRRGDIVIVDLDPTRGHEIPNTRPCVVVQNDVGNRNSKTTIVAPATTTHRDYSFAVFVPASESDFKEDSSVRVDQLRTINTDKRIRFIAGQLPTSIMREIETALKIELALD